MYRIKDSRILRLGLVAALVAGLMVGTGTAAAYEEWEKGNVPGREFDTFDSEAKVKLKADINNNGLEDDPMLAEFTVTGRTKIKRSTSGIPDWDGNDPRPGEPDNFADIRTEIVSMKLTGVAPIIGSITIKAGSAFGLPASTGAIERLQDPGDPALQVNGGQDWPSYSFFDIYFELSPTPWGLLTNPVPARMEATISAIPPYNTDYTLANPPVIFEDGSGIPRVWLYGDTHTPLFPPPVPVFPNWYTMMAAVAAAGGLGYLLWRRRLAHEQA